MAADGGIQDNRDLLAKADLALADLTSGGLLLPAQAQKFIRILIDESRLMKVASVVPMKSQKQRVEKIRFASRIMRAGASATALSEADRAKPDLSKVELDAKLAKAEVRIDNETLEDNIERDTLRQTIMSLIGERVALDMDEGIANGDTTSADSFLALFDGAIKSATSNVVAAGTVQANKTIWRDMLKTMPSPFLRNKAAMRIFTSVDAELDYRDTLSDRATPSGDRALEGAAPVGYGGVMLTDVPVFPENLGGGTNETVALLTDPKNFAVGIWRQIRIETDKDISEGVVKIVVSLRYDFKYIEETAVVKATGIKVA